MRSYATPGPRSVIVGLDVYLLTLLRSIRPKIPYLCWAVMTPGLRITEF